MNNADMPANPCERIIKTTNSTGHGTKKETYLGLTKREYFAGLAMAAYIANFGTHLPKDAVNDADSLLKELDK